MRKLTLLFFALLLPAGAAISVTCNTGFAPTGNPATTGSIDSTGAWMLTISHTATAFTPTLAVVNDSKTDSWHIAATSNHNNVSVGLLYSFDHGGSALSVGAGHTATVTSNYPGVIFCAWSGATATLSDPWDSTQHSEGFGTPVTSIAISPLTPVANTHGTLFIASMGMDNTPGTVTATGFTEVIDTGYAAGVHMFNSMAWAVQGTSPSSLGTTYASGGAADDMTGVLATFQITSGTVSTPKGSVLVW